MCTTKRVSSHGQVRTSRRRKEGDDQRGGQDNKRKHKNTQGNSRKQKIRIKLRQGKSNEAEHEAGRATSGAKWNEGQHPLFFFCLARFMCRSAPKSPLFLGHYYRVAAPLFKFRGRCRGGRRRSSSESVGDALESWTESCTMV